MLTLQLEHQCVTTPTPERTGTFYSATGGTSIPSLSNLGISGKSGWRSIDLDPVSRRSCSGAESVSPQGSRQVRPARPSLDGEQLLFILASGEYNSRRTCAVTRRDSRLAAYFLPLTNRRPAVTPCCYSRLFAEQAQNLKI